MTALIELRGLAKTHGHGDHPVAALRGVDVTIPAASVTAILGPSGSGKSTLLNLLGALDRPSAGTITFDGRDVGGLDEAGLTEHRRHDIGFVFQHYNLIPYLTAAENVAIGCPDAADPVDPVEALDRMGLADKADAFPSELSGGQMQRVAIARALAKRPRVLLCDEPTGALDSASGQAIMTALQDAAVTTGAAVVIVSHNPALEQCADQVIHLRDGAVTAAWANPEPKPAAEVAW